MTNSINRSMISFKEYIKEEKIAGLVNKSEKVVFPMVFLKRVMIGVWQHGKLVIGNSASQQQWAFARVNSMLTGGKADPDLQAKIRSGGYKKKKKDKKGD